mmetsp:Transcript_19860/g.57988  ORF Transcript_19860/g.57988 Transcript_19860/m.57988 type:complete len:238 (+) Transcript_19860:760-1473(+)
MGTGRTHATFFSSQMSPEPSRRSSSKAPSVRSTTLAAAMKSRTLRSPRASSHTWAAVIERASSSHTYPTGASTTFATPSTAPSSTPSGGRSSSPSRTESLPQLSGTATTQVASATLRAPSSRTLAPGWKRTPSMKLDALLSSPRNARPDHGESRRAVATRMWGPTWCRRPTSGEKSSSESHSVVVSLGIPRKTYGTSLEAEIEASPKETGTRSLLSLFTLTSERARTHVEMCRRRKR